MTNTNTKRDARNGQYASDMDGVCVCGHQAHTEVTHGVSECIGHEFGECAEQCDCPRYRKRRVRKAK